MRKSLVSAVLFGIAVLMIAAPSSAAISNYTCSGTGVSVWNATVVVKVNGNTSNIDIGKDKVCVFGCNAETGRCNEAQQESAFSAILVPLIASASLMVVGLFWQIKRPWDLFYRIFFIFFGLFFLVSAFGIANGIFQYVPNIPEPVRSLAETNLVNSTWLQYMLLAVFITFGLIELFLMLKDIILKKNEEKRRERGEI